MVRVGRLELPASCSQSKRATNCATPGYEIFQLWSNMWSTPIFDQLPARGKVLSAQVSQGFPGFPKATARTWASRSQNVCLNLQPALYRPLWPFPLLRQFIFDTLLPCVFQAKLSPFGIGVGLDSVY